MYQSISRCTGIDPKAKGGGSQAAARCDLVGLMFSRQALHVTRATRAAAGDDPAEVRSQPRPPDPFASFAHPRVIKVVCKRPLSAIVLRAVEISCSRTARGRIPALQLPTQRSQPGWIAEPPCCRLARYLRCRAAGRRLRSYHSVRVSAIQAAPRPGYTFGDEGNPVETGQHLSIRTSCRRPGLDTGCHRAEEWVPS
jgi:hypothetical protein